MSLDTYRPSRMYFTTKQRHDLRRLTRSKSTLALYLNDNQITCHGLLDGKRIDMGGRGTKEHLLPLNYQILVLSLSSAYHLQESAPLFVDFRTKFDLLDWIDSLELSVAEQAQTRNAEEGVKNINHVPRSISKSAHLGVLGLSDHR